MGCARLLAVRLDLQSWGQMRSSDTKFVAMRPDLLPRGRVCSPNQVPKDRSMSLVLNTCPWGRFMESLRLEKSHHSLWIKTVFSLEAPLFAISDYRYVHLDKCYMLCINLGARDPWYEQKKNLKLGENHGNQRSHLQRQKSKGRYPRIIKGSSAETIVVECNFQN